MDSRENLGGQGGNQDMVSQDPVSVDIPAPAGPNQDIVDGEDNRGILRLPFPTKMWLIVESDAIESVRWSDDGDVVIIDKDLFQTEVLCRTGAPKLFETDSLKSFIRQLNLYGFVKIHSTDSQAKKTMLYRNANFKRDHPQLLKNIRRKVNTKDSPPPATAAVPPKRMKPTATRQCHQTQGKDPNTATSPQPPLCVPWPSVNQSISLSVAFTGSCGAEGTLEEPPPAQPNMPSTEATAHSVPFGPQVHGVLFGPQGQIVPIGPPGHVVPFWPAAPSVLFGPPAHIVPFGPSALGVPFRPPGHRVPFGPLAHGVQFWPPVHGLLFGPPACIAPFGPPGHGVPFGPLTHGVPFGPPAHGVLFGPPARIVPFAPPASGRLMGEPLTGPGVHTNSASAMPMYNACHSTLQASLAFMGPREPSAPQENNPSEES